MNKRKNAFLVLVSLLLTGLLATASQRADSQRADNFNPSLTGQQVPPRMEHQQLKITVGSQTVIAQLVASETTRDFVKLLPLTLRLEDLGDREKYGALPTRLSEVGTVRTTYQVGDIAYWLGGGVAAFYHQDGHQVKAGLIVLARLPEGTTLFTVPGAQKVRFEAVEKP